MAFDGITLYAVVDELRETIVGAKINKIYQPRPDEILVFLRTPRGELKLLISAHPVDCRLHITSHDAKNPMSPPMFCMLLRKHLIGGKIVEVSQQGLERIVTLSILNNDEFMSPREYKLMVEIMGKHSNVVLVDAHSGTIVDAIKKVSSNINRYREILPGLPYLPPPLDNKANLLNSNLGEIYMALRIEREKNSRKTISKWLLERVMGISGTSSQEICFQAGVDGKKEIALLTQDEIENLLMTLEVISKEIVQKSFRPRLYHEKQAVVEFWVFPMRSQKGYEEKLPTANGVVDAYFERKRESTVVKSAAKEISKAVNKHLKKLQQNLFFYNQRLEDAQEKDRYRLWGEILSANLYRIKPGLEEVTLPNYYDENREIVIPLESDLSPAKNAQRYFHLYKKLQATEAIVKKRRDNYLLDIDYLENTLLSLEHSESLEDINEIRYELEAQGYLKRAKKTSTSNAQSKPLRFITSDGFYVFVGKNNRQNDYLTFKKANAMDIWAHAKDIPGSHVIISSAGAEVTEKALLEACTLAAYFSKAQGSSNVPVDYTFVKYVKKPAGAKPGYVNYTHQKTLYVTPDKSLVDKLSL